MVSAALVRDLRERTGVGMMDCKKVLVEANGDFDIALDLLRKKGLAGAAKKAGRLTAEGVAAIHNRGKDAVVIEMNSETDFVALNEKFQGLVSKIVRVAVDKEDIDSLKSTLLPNGITIADEITENIASIGENLSLRRMDKVKVKEGVIATYVHNSVADDMGKIGVLLAIESSADQSKLITLGKQIAMHIAASSPRFLTSEEISPEVISKEKEIFFEQSRASGKPDNIIEKMVDGRIRKFFEETVLLDQIFVIDGKTRISELLSNASKELGARVSISKFIRYSVGEGIEQEKKNFADEVAAVIG
jgi:elongation factor Ts